MDLIEQVKNITSTLSGVSDDAIGQFINDGIKDVTDRIIQVNPPKMLLFSTNADTDGANDFPVESGIVLGVNYKGRPATMIEVKYAGLASDPDSLHYRTAYNPAWYYDKGVVNTVPALDAVDQGVIVSYIGYAGYEAGDGAWAYVTEDRFPAQYEHIVVLYAAGQSYQRALAEIELPILLLPPEPTAPTIDWTMPNAPTPPISDWSVIQQTLDEIEMPSSIVMPTMEIQSLETWAGGPLGWNYPQVPAQPILDFTGVTQEIDNINLPADVVLPTLSIDEPGGLDWAFPTAPVLPDLQWGDLEYWIKEEEDPEMAQTRIAAVQTQVQSFSGTMQAYASQISGVISKNQGLIASWGDEWKTKAQVYQQQLSALIGKYQGESTGKQAIVQAQVAARNSQVQEIVNKAQATVQIYQAKVNVFQAEVTKIIQGNQAIIQGWSSEIAAKVNKYQAEVGAITTTYQSEIAGKSQAAQAQVTIRQSEVQQASQKAQTDIAAYNSQVQMYQADLSSIIQRNQVLSQNWQAELSGKYAAQIQAALGEFNAKVQALSADYQWLYGRYTAIRQQYNEAIGLQAAPKKEERN